MLYQARRLKQLSQALAYQFNDESLLMLAVTHKSVLAKESIGIHGYNNERLEFLGDAILSVVSAEFLFKFQPALNEGNLSRLRAQYICQEHLAQSAKKINLSDYIHSDKAMKRSGSTNSKAVLADAVEAIIGAVFLDGGLDAARQVVLHILGEPSTVVSVRDKDAKTKLQEIIQATGSVPKYQVLSSTGPAHAPHFVVGVCVEGKIIAQAAGENKKIAEQNAAQMALKELEQAKSGGSH